MFSPNERAKIIALINREVVPAIGCTEPIAVALCTARAAELLDTQPEKIEVRLSANILKNAMGVGIPGTGMIGLPIAVALGALVGRSEYQLEVLRDVTPEAVGRGARYIDEKRVCISLKEDISEKLYIEVEASAGERRAVAVIAGGHTAFVYLERDGGVLLDKRTASVAEEEAGEVPLTLRRVWDFAMTAPLDELRFILETRRVNKAAAERAFAGEFGHCVGRTLRCERERQVMGDSIFSRILSYTSAACDARMAGAMIPVMSNSGSGNQGIAATLPVVVYADETAADEEHTIRALVLSHLTVIYIKQSRPSVCLVRLRRGGDGIELRHHLPDGRRLRAGRRGGQEHDRQPHRHDLRRGQAQLFDETHERRLDRRALGHDGDGRSLRDARRGNYRGGRRQVHPQPDGHRPRRHERDRPARAGNYDT